MMATPSPFGRRREKADRIGGDASARRRLRDAQADRGPVLVVVAVGGPGGRGAGLAALGGVEASRPDHGADASAVA